MAGEEEKEEREEGFVWDAESNLFYHSSTGFYHDPIAGWYYSSKDGLYYAFQDGNYVLIESKMDEGSEEPNPCEINEYSEKNSHCEDNNPESYSRPSEWLDEILINQYLSGYPKPETNSNNQPTEIVLSSEEETWLAQYGQVDQNNNNTIPLLNDKIKPIDLYDWELINEGQNRKITGRLTTQLSKLHPSTAGFLKTASIRQTNLDLVLVSSGKVYRLRTPSGKYLAGLLAYDSSNPTKDWGFPNIFTNSQFQLKNVNIDSIVNLDQSNNDEEKRVYRDRAAERRKLHGINGIAPFQKGANNNNNNSEMDLECDATSAQEEARQLAFGKGSYARKIMQNMGWKDGEVLGSSQKGIVEPVEAVGNKGQAGLGFKN